MSRPVERVGVVVPAANEEEQLPSCLASLQIARQRAARLGIEVRIVVVLDGCTDRSAEVVAAALRVESVTVDRQCVGAVRAAGTAHLMSSDPDSTRLWLANTDADCVVPPEWIEVMVQARADVVLGTVRPHPMLEPALTARWHARHDLNHGHGHVHGANMGIHAEILELLGGWAPLAVGEDVDLARRAAAMPGISVDRTALAPVLTSSRLTGRAPSGFAGYLRELAVTATATAADELAG